MENSKERFIDNSTNESKYKIKKNNIDEDDAIDLFHLLLDNEVSSTTPEEVRRYSHLVEVWRPIAEGPLD
jgi:hypothetical protein